MIYVNLTGIFLGVLLFAITRNYKKDEINNLNNKRYPLKELYPTGLFILDKFITKIPLSYTKDASDKVKQALEVLHIGEKSEFLKRIYLCKKIVYVIMIIFLTNFFSLIALVRESPAIHLIEGRYLERLEFGKGTNNADMKVRIGDGEETILEKEMRIEISERQRTEEELELLLKEGVTYLESVILLKNKEADAIKTDLFLPKVIPSTGIKITWMSEDKNIINDKGEINNTELLAPKLLWVRGILKVANQEVTYTRYFKIYPKEYSEEELIQKQLLEEIDRSNKNSRSDNKLSLPIEVGDHSIVWSLTEKKSNNFLFFLGVITALLIYFGMDKDLKSKVDKRNQEMLLDYPDIINKFTLLVGAGMSLSNAWSKIASDYNKEVTVYKYAYEEMNITARELSVGASEITAYERFGRRVKLLPYLRFSSLIAQSVKKGSKDLLEQLELESINAFAERKELAKRLGEEAGTKLLMPMMLMLILILVIILVPAFLSFQL